jgi:hypothetical protein
MLPCAALRIEHIAIETDGYPCTLANFKQNGPQS